MILNIAFYKFVELNEIELLRPEMKDKALSLGIRGTVLLSVEGINGFLAGERDQIHAFQAYLATKPEFSNLVYKESYSETIPFTRMLVKLKKEIISMGDPTVKPHLSTGKRIEAKELKQWLDEKKEVILLDTRNDYEIALGTFNGAVDFNIDHFRKFPEKLKEAKESLKDKPVVMFCTGGIRCEKATAAAENIGLENVYQLEGGILKYFEECGPAHYNGECFVFDYRTALDPYLNVANAVQCFNCRAVVTEAGQKNPKYVPGQSCPKCV